MHGEMHAKKQTVLVTEAYNALYLWNECASKFGLTLVDFSNSPKQTN